MFRDGKKLPGALVRLAAAGFPLSPPYYVGSDRGEERKEIEAHVAPTARTGPDGVARFENLLPGAFEVVASVDGGPGATAIGIAAPARGKAEVAVEIRGRPGPVRFRVVGPDGAPVARRSAALNFGRGRLTSATSIELDGEGVGAFDFGGPGLWAIEVRFRDADLRSFPLQQEPYDLAAASIPVSPAPALENPVELRAVRREPGSIRARLLDAGGKPARGTLMIVGTFEGAIDRAGTVDAEGVVRFAGLPSGKYRLRGFVDGQPPAPRLRLGTPLLGDEALRGHATVLDREVTIGSGEEANVDLRLEPVGYVRATIRPPAGRPASDYSAYLKTDPPVENGWSYQADPKSGSYLFGPVRAGRASLLAWEKTRSVPYPTRGERAVAVEAGKVVRVEVEAKPDPASPVSPRSGQQVSLGLGGIRVLGLGPGGLVASVFLADGTTPAFGARASFYPAGDRSPTAIGIADASGRLTWTGFWRGQSQDDAKGPEPLKTPTIAVWMPGLAGAATATVEEGKPVRLVLPAPAGGSGRVTIGGRGTEGRAAGLRVVAEAEGRGVLAGAFSRATTADPDGRFRLPGLAPGRYRVQAVRDEIWLSRAVALTIEPGRESAPIELDIPEPGAPIELEMVDRGGRPVPGLGFSIRRPEGPLAGELAIAQRADDRGIAIVRGLESGPQSLVVDGDRTPRAFDVPRAAPGAGAKAIRIEVDRP